MHAKRQQDGSAGVRRPQRPGYHRSSESFGVLGGQPHLNLGQAHHDHHQSLGLEGRQPVGHRSAEQQLGQGGGRPGVRDAVQHHAHMLGGQVQHLAAAGVSHQPPTEQIDKRLGQRDVSHCVQADGQLLRLQLCHVAVQIHVHGLKQGLRRRHSRGGQPVKNHHDLHGPSCGQQLNQQRVSHVHETSGFREPQPAHSPACVGEGLARKGCQTRHAAAQH
mmetsp:Transcript_134991/g.305552  ORF Transcript_134991/g.305552 Transcript_134991/m.305552 type:complete len:219 (-) Transcript_134991:440-1096(-)